MKISATRLMGTDTSDSTSASAPRVIVRHATLAAVPAPCNSLATRSGPIPLNKTGYARADMPTEAEVLRTILFDARLAAYPYTRKPASLPGHWTTSTDLAEQVCRHLRVPDQSRVQSHFGVIVDGDTGLVVTVLANPKTKEVVAAFGGTTSGRTVRGNTSLAGDAFVDLPIVTRQWLANAQSVFGSVPRSYKLARDVLQHLQNELVKPPWAGFVLRTVGHSKGGAEAAYAALSLQEPVCASVFGPNHLSAGLVASLPRDNVARAPELVKSYSVETDMVPQLHRYLGGGHHAVGTEHFYPPDTTKGASYLHVHVCYVDHLESWLAKHQ
jgi:hypothetical protein